MKRLMTAVLITGATLFALPGELSAHCGMNHGPLSATGYYGPFYGYYPFSAPPVYYYPSYPQIYYGPVYYGRYRYPATTFRYRSGVRSGSPYSNYYYRGSSRHRWRY